MLNKNIVYGACDKGDVDGIIELLKIAFPRWKTYRDPVGYWSWKYNSCP
jgi:hypothetical protein